MSGSLLELRVLLAVVDGGSVVAGARRLGRSPPSVSRILGELEAGLGTQLVERTTRRCRATEAGERLAEQARLILSLYQEAMEDASGERQRLSGRIRLAAPLVFGRRLVAPALLDFLEAQPAVSVELRLSDSVVDLAEEDFDAAIRMGRIDDDTLVVRRIGEVRRLVVAAPDYLLRRGEPDTPEALRGHEVIHHLGRGLSGPWPMRVAGGAIEFVEAPSRLAVDDAETALDAARNGRGITTALSYQVAADLEAGRLRRILVGYELEPMPAAIVWPAPRRRLRRVAALIDHLTARLSASPLIVPLT